MGFSRKKLKCWGYNFFFKLIPLDFQSILSWPLWIFHFFALTPLEILVFPSNFDIPLVFQLLLLYPLPWKFLLIFSTGRFQKKLLVILFILTIYCWNQIIWIVKSSSYQKFEFSRFHCCLNSALKRAVEKLNLQNFPSEF